MLACSATKTIERQRNDRQAQYPAVVIDVDKALTMPSLVEIAEAIQGCDGVTAHNITVTEVDQETIGTSITIEGDGLDYDALVRAIENSGAVVHSLDQLVCGDRVIEYVPRAR